MLNNIELFEKCLQNKVASIDYTSKDIRNKIVLPDNENNNELLNANEELIELLDKYKKYNEENDISKNKEIIEKIDECLKVEGMNYSPFSQYIMIYDVTYYMYLSQLTLQEKEYIIKNYIEDRHNMYKKYGYYKEDTKSIALEDIMSKMSRDNHENNEIYIFPSITPHFH